MLEYAAECGAKHVTSLPDAEVEPLVEHASHFHARGGRRGLLQERFAHNTIDYGRIVDFMGQTGYRGGRGIK